VNNIEYSSSANWFYKLKKLASKDLSAAHLHQHRQSAKNFIELAGISHNGLGVFSTGKRHDTISLIANVVTGKKYWVSGIPDAEYGVFFLSDNTGFYVDFNNNNVQSELLSTVGMEKTCTGLLEFTNSNTMPIDNLVGSRAQLAQLIHSYGFLTNAIGLAEGFYNQIDSITSTLTNIIHQKQKIELHLQIANTLWERLFFVWFEEKNYVNNHNEYNMLWTFSKELLIDICHLTQIISLSGIYINGTLEHQQYKDALIFSSHMQNFYHALDFIKQPNVKK
jgi:hypothetical protein